ncbi:MAG TPA: nickel pincer cofactor biosynthesis protein LarC [Kribbellaceae bacterium]
MTLAWIDCSAGASGDMLLGAFLDAGAELAAVNAAVAAVDPSLSVTTDRTSRHQIAALKATVRVDGVPHPEGPAEQVGDTPADTGHQHAPVRPWREVRALIDRAGLDDPVRGRALDVFARLARAEAQAHGVEPDEVHFHEVGALDAIADIVGVAAAVHSLGLTRVVVSPVVLGAGRQVRGRHGGIPVPGPAVLAVLAEAGAPVLGGSAPYEMTTPTGAALLASLADEFGPLPPMRIGRVGVGAGGRDPEEVPNVLRVVLGTPVARSNARDLVYETNVDDLDPRVWPAVLAKLLEAGASDAWLTPILMKKGRPAYTLSVLTRPDRADAVRRVVFAETSAIGLRESTITKHAAEREFRTVDVGGQRISVKIASYDGKVVNVQPEYDDVVAAAAALGRPVKAVLAAAIAASSALWT